MKILLNYLKLTTIILLCCSTAIGSAQSSDNERAILTEFYESTNGENWINHTNWLKEGVPLSEWHGVVMDGNHVIELHLNKNNLKGEIPEVIKNLAKLIVLNCADNGLTKLPDLTSLNDLTNVDCRNNYLVFDSFYENKNLAGFLFYPQKKYGNYVEEVICIGGNVTLPSGLTGNYDYQWYKDGNVLNGQQLSQGDLVLENLSSADRGVYHCEVVDPTIPDFVLQRRPVRLSICDYDSLGGKYKTNQLVVQFDPTYSEAQRNLIRDKYNLVDHAEELCGKIELWFLPDTIFIPGGGFLIIIEEIVDQIREDPPIQEVDLNHVAERETIEERVLKQDFYPPIKTPPTTTNAATVVAIIDTGIDYNHPSLINALWKNPTESLDLNDNDFNCAVDDLIGVNFVDSERAPYDDHSHGTHVAGLVQAYADTPVALMTLKTHDEKGLGDIFRMAAGIYYAQSKKADVINMSTGYYGKENKILKAAIQAVQETDIVVVASAGNNATFVDSILHFPSGHNLDNIVAVGSIDAEGDTELSNYSNYGSQTIDLAIVGTQVSSTVPGGGTDKKTGTSMSAAKVSGKLAKAIQAQPNYCFRDIISCLYNATEKYDELATQLRTSGVLNEEGAMDNCCRTPDRFREKIISGNVVQLTWENTNCARTYELLYRKVGDAEIQQKILTTATVTLNNLVPNASYEYILRSICESGISIWSDIQFFITGAEVCDIPMVNEIYLPFYYATTGEYKISWEPQGTNVIYEFQYLKAGDSLITILTTQPFVDLSLEVGQKYFGRIRTHCTNFKTNWTTRFSFPGQAPTTRVGNGALFDELTLFPNPAVSNIKVQIKPTLPVKKVMLQNANGIILQEKLFPANEFVLDLQSYPAGMYFLIVVLQNGKRVTKKFIKVLT